MANPVTSLSRNPAQPLPMPIQGAPAAQAHTTSCKLTWPVLQKIFSFLASGSNPQEVSLLRRVCKTWEDYLYLAWPSIVHKEAEKIRDQIARFFSPTSVTVSEDTTLRPGADLLSCDARFVATRLCTPPVIRPEAQAIMEVIKNCHLSELNQQLIEPALVLAHTVPFATDKNGLYRGIAITYARRGNIEKACAVTRTVSEESKQGEIFRCIIVNCITKRLWDKACAAAQLIPNPFEQDQSFFDIAGELLHSGYIDRALRIAQTLPDRTHTEYQCNLKSDVTRLVTRAYIKAFIERDNLETAFAIALIIEDPIEKNRQLNEVLAVCRQKRNDALAILITQAIQGTQ